MTKHARRERRKRRRVASRLAIRADSSPSTIHLTGEGVVELQASDGDEKLKTFTMTAYTGGSMRPNNFSSSVVIDLSGLKTADKSRPIFRDHDSSQIVGHTTEVVNDGNRISLAGVMSGAGDHVEEIIQAAANGFPWQSSVGVSVEKMARVDGGQEVTVNGRTFTGPLLVARSSELREISFVALGADDKTSAKVAASAAFQIEVESMKFNEWLKANGFDADSLSDDQKAPLRAAYDAAGSVDEGADQTSSSSDLVADMAALSAETRIELSREHARVRGITSLCASADHPYFKVAGEDIDLAAHAIKEGWTPERTELEVLRIARATAPAVHEKSHEAGCTLDAMQGALVLRAGASLDNPLWQTKAARAIGLPRWMSSPLESDQRQIVMEASHRYSDFSFLDICREAARLDGTLRGDGRQEVIKAAFSGSALTNVFTTSVNAILLSSYTETGDSTEGWTTSADVGDFKTQERPRVDVGPGLDKLPRGGSADHADYADTLESYKIARYAKQFVVDEQDIIDDRLDALSDVPQRMGQAAAWLRPDLVYSIFIANANLDATTTALYHADQDQGTGNGNLDTGAALASGTLRTGISAMSLFQESSRNLNIQATHLIVPPTLTFTARELIESSTILLGADDESIRGSKNVLMGMLSIVSDARLENGVTDPASGTVHAGQNNDWFLASRNAHTIEVGYLRGTGRSPTVRNFTLSEGKYGMGWDVKLDIGAKALDWKGLYAAQG